jgi:hypothetical protein
MLNTGRMDLPDDTRVARWQIFKPITPIWVNFGGPWKDIFYCRFKYIALMWYILWSFDNLVWYIFLGFGVLRQEKSGNPG